MTRAPRHRELLAAMLGGARLAVTPVFAHRHHPHDDQDGEALAEASLAWWRRYDFDLIKLTPASTWQLRDHGVEDRDDPDDPLGRRAIISRPISRTADWTRLRPINPHQGFTSRILDATRQIKRAAPDVPVLVTVYAPVSQAIKLAGQEVFSHHLSVAPDVVAAGLVTLTANTIRLVGALIDIGIDGVFLAIQTARASLFPSAEYVRWALASDLACLEAASTLPLNIAHVHGVDAHVGLFEQRPPALLHTEVISAPRAIDGGGVVAGPSPWGVLSRGRPEQVLAECRTWLTRPRAGPFILAPSCTVPTATPAANLDALVAAARTPHPHEPTHPLELA